MHIHPRHSFTRSAFALVALALIALSAREASATWPVEAGSAGLNKAMDGWCSLPEAIEAVNLGTKTGAGATHFDCVNSGGGTDIMLEGVWWARYRTFGATITKSTSIYAWIIDGEPVVEDSGPVTLRVEGTEPDGMGGTKPIDVYLFSIKLEHSGAGLGRVLDNRAHLYLFETVISGGNVQGNTGQAGDGGGILNLGNLEIQKSIITNNRATRGGGIFTASVDGTGMHEVTVDNNNASQQGGGIYSAGRLFVVRSTISSNVATSNGGGIFAAAATNAYCELFFTTVAFNRGATGGGVFINNTAVNTVTNGSIVGSNVRTNNALDDYSGFPNREAGQVETDGIRNLFRTGLGVQSPAPMDLIGFDPQLGMLTHFNGSFTRTHPLAPGSPARNVALVGSPFNDGYDQNYESRPEPGADLGSFELQ